MFSKFAKLKPTLLMTGMMLASVAAMAQPKAPSTMSNPLAQMLVFIMILLLLAIAILGNVVNSAAALFREKLRKQRESGVANSGSNSALAIVVLLVSSLLVSASGIAQEAADAAAAAPAPPTTINGLSQFTFYLLISVIAVEVIILIALTYQLKFLVGIESKRALKAAGEAVVVAPKESWWWRLNKSVAVTEEKEIDLSHDYDGISELDNKLPPWWIAAFAITILFSGVYLWRYHVSHSAPLMHEELAIAMKQAEVEKAAYLAKSANNVDENTVKMLDAGGVALGKSLYDGNCVACHGAEGQGGVGPNLTDKFWLHGGAINDVFKVIKYGVVEKGMRSWKDDFSPVQVAQLASFVKSLSGTNPPNAKEAQGQEYTEGATNAATVTDSTSAAPASK